MGIINFLITIALILLGINSASAGLGAGTETNNPATMMQRDTARRQDLARVAASIAQYQTNNNGRTPMQQNPMPDAEKFIQWYLLGSDGDLDDFMDPNGVRYKLQFSNFDTGQKYGLIDEMDYTIYVVGKAACDGEKVVASEKPRDYAVSYKLENGSTYCDDSW